MKAGEYARVERVGTDELTGERLRMLNVDVGAKIRLLKNSFFGRTYLIEADGVRLGVRRSVAEKILVERLEEERDGQSAALSGAEQ